jgi:hypothetical protein
VRIGDRIETLGVEIGDRHRVPRTRELLARQRLHRRAERARLGMGMDQQHVHSMLLSKESGTQPHAHGLTPLRSHILIVRNAQSLS